MTLTKELQAIVDQLGIDQNKNILFLTLTKAPMDDILMGEKDVEYRDATPHNIGRFFKKDKNGHLQAKPFTHILFQNGYSLNSPRIFVEMKGLNHEGQTWPAPGVVLPEYLSDLGYIVYPDAFNLLLGQVLWASDNYPESKPIKASRPKKEVQKIELQMPDVALLKPINVIEVDYAQTGESQSKNNQGMREMQAKAYQARAAQHLLIKAPPASGKSRALMFIALDKLQNQGIKKVIVAVPEKSIGESFSSTPLSAHGFFADWDINPKYNLCTAGSNESKTKIFQEFMASTERVLVCTHATFRFAYETLRATDFDDCLVAIDEFHHVSADENNILGNVIKQLLDKSKAHLLAMTGSYFRGDGIPVLMPEDEAKFTKVTYTYYQQLNGYEHLKSLGIGYHFYRGKYFRPNPETGLSALAEILDENLKTIIHIPSVNSAESSKEKHEEVNHIIDVLGELQFQDEKTGVLHIKSKKTGRILKVADLVNDESLARNKISTYLRQVKSPEGIDMIIALGMAKEGFDWPYCQHALTIGYRGSLTEIIQIIGRATRDSHNKSHAQFTNLIAQPEAEEDDVKISVNNMLKAITASLLMEQVMAPNFKFKLKRDDDDEINPDEKDENGDTIIHVRGFKLPSSQRAKEIIESDLNELKAAIFQDPQMLKAMPGNLPPETMNQVLMPKVIRERYPELSEDDVEAVRQQVVLDSVMKNSTFEEVGDKKFIRMAASLVNIQEVHIDLIDQVNPFQKAFEVLSKSVTKQVLKLIDEHIQSTKIDMTLDEAMVLFQSIKTWKTNTGHDPSLNSHDPKEKRMAEAILFLKDLQRKQLQHEQ